MHTREDFIAAIRAEPKCDTLRLVYADWLDEFGDCDRDRATAEFIRLSCDRSGKRRAPDAAYRWLYEERYPDEFDRAFGAFEVVAANWKRLVPGLVSRHTSQFFDYGDIGSARVGRRVSVRGSFDLPPRKYHLSALTLEFERGFVVGVRLSSPSWLRYLAPVLLADQPLCERAREAVESGNAVASRIVRGFTGGAK